MTRGEFVRRFVTVHKCVGCGEILDYEHSDSAYCEFCRLGFNAALTVGCNECFKPARECTCMPTELRRSGALVLRKLFFYDSENRSLPEIKLIYLMKSRKYRRITLFVTEHMMPLILEETQALGIAAEQLAVTGIPRCVGNRNLYGFDHTELLARCICEELGIKYFRILRSRLGARVQKSLDAKKRVKNALGRIRSRGSADISGKYVILIDDMVTTGASMSAAVKCLMAGGAKGVMCFSMASKNKM